MKNKKSDPIQVILCEPEKKACITTINNTLKALQQLVGGYIEAIYPFDDPVAIICNEEGKLNRLELNRSLRDEGGRIYDIVAGTFLVVGLGEDNFVSLSSEFQQKYLTLFEHPELFIYVENGILAIPIIN